MATLILNNDSISVQLESEHLIVTKHSTEERQTLPLKDVDRVVVIGRPAVTFAALSRIMDKGIPCVFMTKSGRLRGTIDTMKASHVSRRIVQYDRFRDPKVRLELSVALIQSKLQNCRRVIQRLCANRSLPVSDLGEHWVDFQGCMSELGGCESTDAVRGLEGIASFHYFRLLSLFFPGDFPFPARSRRPPLDEANALLSFIYTHLMNEMTAFVRLHALDVGLGFLHEDQDRSPSLALDLMESFRPGFADLLTINTLGHGRLQKDSSFVHDEETGGVYLAGEARKKVLIACESALTRSFVARGELSHTTMRQALDRQVIALVRYLERGEAPRFFRLA